MKAERNKFLCGILSAAFMAAPTSVPAQQIYGADGSPEATRSISGKQPPPPDPNFGGEIKENTVQSKPWRPLRAVPSRLRPTCCSS